jgi:hypothetical protein
LLQNRLVQCIKQFQGWGSLGAQHHPVRIEGVM